ncbi:universal stress protein [Streptomyces sp. NBC_01497]|uniref:universal stress protein n=1 Tax=Streptomyces sp. NBC_01497 TaxID=2903885 RepID=UPI002E349B58|nr:universal stress protein [Streptomyces sp. NBC_01497]
MFRRILVTVDGTERNQKELKTAAELAAALGASVHVVHVEGLVPSAWDDEINSPETSRALQEGADQIAAAGVSVTKEFVHAPESTFSAMIIEAADRFGADLIVAAPRQHSLLRSVLEPSVSVGLARHSKVAVLLVP